MTCETIYNDNQKSLVQQFINEFDDNFEYSNNNQVYNSQISSQPTHYNQHENNSDQDSDESEGFFSELDLGYESFSNFEYLEVEENEELKSEINNENVTDRIRAKSENIIQFKKEKYGVKQTNKVSTAEYQSNCVSDFENPIKEYSFEKTYSKNILINQQKNSQPQFDKCAFLKFSNEEDQKEINFNNQLLTLRNNKAQLIKQSIIRSQSCIFTDKKTIY